MSIFNRLFKGAQGNVNNALEAAADKNLIPEIEQRIRDTKAKQVEVDKSTARAIAELNGLNTEMETIVEEFEKRKRQIKEVAEEKGREDPLVAKIGQKLTTLQTQIESKKNLIATKEQTVESFKSQKRVNETAIEKMEMEIQQLKDNAELIKAKKANAELRSSVSGNATTAAESIDRLKKQQAMDMAELEAAESLSQSASANLDDEIDSALGTGGNNVDQWL